jgi:trigger factor
MADEELKDQEGPQNPEETDAQADEPQEGEAPEGEAPEDEKLQFTLKVDDSGAWKKKISIEIPRDQIDKELDNQYKELRHKAEVPGFRKGRAPRRLIEKRFGSDIADQTKFKLLAQVFEQIEEQQDFEVLGEPDLEVEKIELPKEGDFTIEYEVEVKPRFELPALEGVKVEKPLFEVTDERVDAALDQLRQRQGRIENVTEAQQNDVVRADVTMKVEGVEEPETSEDVPVRVGSAAVMGVMIEDMGKVLTGAKIGDTKECAGEVPETHEKEEYHGKKAEITLEVKSIQRMVPAELDEQFFLALGVEDESELKQRIEENLEQQSDREIRQQMAQQVYKYLDDEIKIDLPEGVASRHADRFLARRYYDLLQQGVPAEQIRENLEQFRAASSDEANRQLKMSFVMEEVADKLEIEVTDAQVNGVIAQIAAGYRRRPERVREEMEREGRLDSLKNQLRDERAIDKILEMAEVVDAPVKQEKPEEDKPKKRTPRKKTTTKKTQEQDESDVGAEEAEEKDAVPQKKAKKQVKRKPPKTDE